jgi:hypothetical protein
MLQRFVGSLRRTKIRRKQARKATRPTAQAGCAHFDKPNKCKSDGVGSTYKMYRARNFYGDCTQLRYYFQIPECRQAFIPFQLVRRMLDTNQNRC